ncbi:MAG TPA: hemerythrin domain-containing protein [Dissulfurispiraceae bacterium]|nr:hemerythrin domain-containing protein [Dissulfurispiraceae bacterium]
MLKWSEKLSVGVPEIDNQHRQIAFLANLLLEKLPGGSDVLVCDTFDFFETFISDHFRTEERYMISTPAHVYRGTEAHKLAHQSFLSAYRAFRADLDKGAADACFVREFSRWISEWYQEHIQNHDKELGVFLRSLSKKPRKK